MNCQIEIGVRVKRQHRDKISNQPILLNENSKWAKYWRVGKCLTTRNGTIANAKTLKTSRLQIETFEEVSSVSKRDKIIGK